MTSLSIIASERRLSDEGTGAPILELVRRATQHCHEAVEQRVDLMNRIKTRHGYRRLLETFYGLYAPLEAVICQAASQVAVWLPDLHERMRADLLKRDLSAFENPRLDSLPMAVPPRFTSVSELLGCMYVLEGSTLGGQVISRAVAANLGFTPENGCAFFHGHGAKTAEYWRRFRLGIEAYAACGSADHGAISQSAVGTFELFAAWIAANLLPAPAVAGGSDDDRTC